MCIRDRFHPALQATGFDAFSLAVPGAMQIVWGMMLCVYFLGGLVAALFLFVIKLASDSGSGRRQAGAG